MNDYQCLFPACEMPAHARGLCNQHYHIARRLVSINKLTTWEELERKGKTRPKQPIAFHDITGDQDWFLE